jgi:phage tail tube protein FII
MASTIRHLDMVNLFAGDDDPTKSLFLVIKNVKLPSREETTKEHSGGGAIAGIELGMRYLRALAVSFQLEGLNPDENRRFMPSAPARINYTMRGNVRDIRDHTDIEFKAIIEGRMTKVDLSEFDRDKGTQTDYEIKEIVRYTEYFGGVEKFHFDYFSGPAGLRIDGVLAHATAARNLGLA